MIENLSKYPFPDLTDAEIIFSTQAIPNELLEEAHRRGMDHPTHPYNRLAVRFFESREEFPEREHLDPEYSERARRFLQAIIRSFVPRHEDKIAVAALLLFALTDGSD